jgi:CPA2 family monovalent cation:H+ antiporter-2
MSILGQLSKITALNWAFGSLSTLLNFPPLIGYIATGFLVGPWVAEYINNPSALYILHEAGDIGLLLLMFFTGMEINIVDFLDRRKASASIKVVLYQFMMSVLTISALVLIVHGIYFISYTELQDINIAFGLYRLSIVKMISDKNNMQILAMVISLVFLNSTAIPIQLLESRNNKTSDLGKTIVSILVMQDIFLIPVIIGLKSFMYQTNIWSIIFRMFMAFATMYLVRLMIDFKEKIKVWLNQYEWLSDEISNVAIVNRALIPIALISFALSCAWISEMIGLSDIYGAFIAGLIVGNMSSDHKLMTVFLPIVDLMSIPVFMNIGVMLNLGDLKQHWHIIGTLSCCVLIIKFIYNYVIMKMIQKETSFSVVSNIQSALLLSQVSEFSFFIIELVSHNLPATEDPILSIVKSTIMICLTLGSILIVSCKQIIGHYFGAKSVRSADHNRLNK